MTIADRFKNFLKSLLSCRLGWMLAVCIFGSVSGLGFLVSIPLYRHLERETMQQLDKSALVLVRSVLKNQQLSPEKNTQQLNSAIDGSPVVGGSVFSAKNKALLTSFGRMPRVGLEHIDLLQKLGVIRRGDKEYFFSVWSPKELGLPYWVIVRIDGMNVLTTMHDFIIRGIDELLWLALFITLLVMLVIYVVFLRPILLLREHTIAIVKGVMPLQEFYFKLHRRDELSTLFEAYNNLIRSMLRKQDLEADIQGHRKNLLGGQQQLSGDGAPQQERRDISREFEISNDNVQPVMRVSEEGAVLYANKASQDLLAYWHTAVGASMPKDWIRLVRSTLRKGMLKELELPAGDKVYLMTLTPLINARCVNIYGFDISKRKQFEAQLKRERGYDRVTDLPGRALLENQLDQQLKIAKRQEDMVMVLCVSLDNMRDITTNYGHDRAELVLSEAAKRIVSMIARTTNAARIEHNKFIITQGSIDKVYKAELLARRLLNSLQQPFVFDDYFHQMNVSIGIACFPGDGQRGAELISNAALSMYRARSQGANHFQFYLESMGKHARERRLMLDELHHAIRLNELILYYQPQVSLTSRKVEGVEALLRWKHSRLGIVSPGQFVSLAEESDLVVKIDDWVLRHACIQIKSWHDQGITPLSLSVNLSARAFYRGDLIKKVKNVIKETGIDPKQLKLEITEGIMLEKPDEIVAIMHEITRLGVQFSIDDFGTGYSSLSYLRDLPVNQLKIDQTFVADMAENNDVASITQTVIQLGHNLHMSVLAEGVETEEQLSLLTEQGCDSVQGYYFSKPLPPEELLEYYQKF